MKRPIVGLGGQMPKRMASVAVALTLAASLAACGGDAQQNAGTGDSGSDAPATIRFYWWGAEERNARMQDAIDIFMSENENITVEGEFAEWGGYWDRLATQVAGSDTPDVFMQEDRYIADYARRGVLADLDDLGVDSTSIDEGLLAAGHIDNQQFGIPTGSNVYSVIINPAIYEAAGIEIPDGDDWTWEDYVETAVAIHENTNGEYYGTSDATFNEVALNVFLRQHGQSLFAEDGSLGYEDALLEEWFQRSLDLQARGGQPPADSAASLDLMDSPIAKGEAAMSITWSAQLGALSEAAGEELEIRKMPGESQFDAHGMYFKPAMYLSASAKTEHPEAVAKFIDFFANDERVGEIFMTELGLPGNPDVRDAIVDQLSPADQRSAEFVSDLSDHVQSALAPLPDGAGEVASIIQRINEQVLFEQITAAEAAQQFRSEVENVIG